MKPEPVKPEQKKPESKKQKGKIIFVSICFLISFLCIAYIVNYYVKKDKNENVYEEIKEQVKEDKVKQEEKPVEPTEPEAPKEKVIPVDFADLQAINEDIYAWIEVPGTQIAYPIVQNVDDSYYLMRTIEKVDGYPGSIYTETVNTKEFTEFNTLIYGHEMKDGTMFGELKKYRDTAFMQENSQILIYTPTKILTYQIFAAVTYDDRHIMKSYDFTDEAQKRSYLESIMASKSMNSPIRDDIKVDESSRIITLSTCVSGQPNNRLLVEAVLVNEE